MPYIEFITSDYRGRKEARTKKKRYLHYYNLLFPGDVAEDRNKYLVVVDRVDLEEKRYPSVNEGWHVMVNFDYATNYFLYRRPFKNWVCYLLTRITGKYIYITVKHNRK